MRMLRMMKNRVRSERIREMTGVEKIEEFLRSQRLRWFGRVERVTEERVPVMKMKIVLDGVKKGRPKKRWQEVVEQDMKIRGLERADATERSKWRLGCRNAGRECVPGSGRRTQDPTSGMNG